MAASSGGWDTAIFGHLGLGDKVIQGVVQKAVEMTLEAFFSSDKGRELVGQIVRSAVESALARTIKVETRRDPNNMGEAVIKEEVCNVLDFLARYLPYVEGAIRGCQADAAAARNRAVECSELLDGVFEHQRAQLIALGTMRSIGPSQVTQQLIEAQ